jgi:phage/conjugal plasmid C-4 type zinc finger TraR family protein
MADDADRAQAQMEWLEEFRQQHRRKHVMRASDYCLDCGELIEAQRLKALPTAERCIFCQQAEENLKRQYG